MIDKYDKHNIVNWGRLQMPSKQSCVCLTHSVYTKCENSCAFAKTMPQFDITTALQ